MNILTFDIEEWFHILDNESTRTELNWRQYESRINKNMDRIFSILDEYDQMATFFCLGWIAEKYPDIIKRIDNLGYEIGIHSYSHQLVYEQTPGRFRKDLLRAKGVLEDIISKKIVAYRAPGFSITENSTWAFEVLIESGIEIDCSIFPAKRSHGGFPDYGFAGPALISVYGDILKEFPINLYPVLGKRIIFSGGGYFRLLPNKLIQHMTESSDYVMTYFHPRDFDIDQPLLSGLSPIRRFKSYYGISGALPKLADLLDRFEFVDLRTANDIVDWSKARVFSLN